MHHHSLVGSIGEHTACRATRMSHVSLVYLPPHRIVWHFGMSVLPQVHPLPDRAVSSVGDVTDADFTPNFEKAREHLRTTSCVNQDGQWRNVFNTRTSDLNEIGGLGIELYFKLLQALGFCFCYMSAFIMPLMVFSWNGNFAVDTASSFGKTTAGNLGNLIEVFGRCAGEIS